MKELFPFFNQFKNQSKIIHYFDSAVTTLKPKNVIDKINQGYQNYTLPIEKSIYTEEIYSQIIIPTKIKLSILFNCDQNNIFFSHSVTILLKQIIELFFKLNNNNKINILIPETVHNSFFNTIENHKDYNNIYFYNLNTFDNLLKTKKFDLIYIPIIDHITGIEIDYLTLETYKKFNPYTTIIGDGSQSGMIQQNNLNNELFDFFLLSSHKMYGPEGLAILFLNKITIEKIRINLEHTKYFLNDFFAQGCLSYVAIYALHETLIFLESYVYNNIKYKEKQIEFIKIIYNELNKKKFIIISPLNTKTLISFYHQKITSNEIATIFSNASNPIYCRSGNLCSIFTKNNDINLIRISLGCYIDQEDINAFINRIQSIL
jgi:selenocysteine lyase/cysteine desulfurase